MANFSIVEYFAEHEGYRCGYCKSPDTNYSHGMWAHSLDVKDYQDLIDRGWRRSGKYCYKPTMNVTCCPMYTIRCAALNFKLSKSQKKVLKKVNNFLVHGKKPESNQNMKVSPEGDSHIYNFCDMPDGVLEKYSSRAKQGLDMKCVDMNSTCKASPKHSNCDPKTTETRESPVSSAMDLSGQSPSSATVHQPQKGIGADPNRPKCKKAKEVRLENKRQKLMKKVERGEITNDKMLELLSVKKQAPEEPKSLEEYLSDAEVESAQHRLRIKLVHSSSSNREFKKCFQKEYQAYKSYQIGIHNDPPEKCSEKGFTKFLVKSPLKVSLVRSGSEEYEKTGGVEFATYQSYQMIIHREKADECNKSGFNNFLVNSPLMSDTSESGPPLGYGSFHQQYWLDDKLVAVGVIDILPFCVSSVYLFYDPEYSFLSLGTYSALREIAFTRELNRICPFLQYYYMGFYIHSCPKMRYKAQYNPSSLLCPETYLWVPYQNCVPKLDASRYTRLDPDSSKGDNNGEVDMSKVLVLHNRAVKVYPKYIQATSNDDSEEVRQYASLVGKRCYRRMLLFRN